MTSAPFASRHLGPRPTDQLAMLQRLGYDSLEDLMEAAVPRGIRDESDLSLPPAASEAAATARLRELAAKNTPGIAMIGLGYYPTETPAVIRRNVLEDPAWYTAYTPYQPEISQGRLEALLNFQTMVSDLTGLPTANASLLDEGTAAAEALTVIRRARRGKDLRPIAVDTRLAPQTLAVLRTRAEAIGIELIETDLSGPAQVAETAGVVIAYPASDGAVTDPSGVIAASHEAGGLAVVVADPLALVALRSPGELGADIVVGSTQRFGVPMFYGGPHAGYMAVRDGLERQLPGRLVGVSVDTAGQPAYRLALQTREQHIRREKATSNICTAQVLLAVVAGMYAVYHGAEGLRAIALSVHQHAATLHDALNDAGIVTLHDEFFDTVVVRVDGRADSVVAAARSEDVHLWILDGDHVQIACSQVTTLDHVNRVLRAFGVEARSMLSGRTYLPEPLVRRDDILTHPVFTEHRSETQLLRYLRRLSDRDYALDRGMIPLGSCTMKLNATTEMEPISWPEFADLHPFVPAADAAGMIELVETLEGWLAEVTGYAAVSVQPNAGSQGELAGLLAIRSYHRSRGDEARDICLIPSSAHGTNAASAVMAGMRVVIVPASEAGEVDLDDLRSTCERHGDQIAAIMVTYPSTHGVYEHGITELCEIVHGVGGQVYVDGANLNALLGHARPGEFGGDVSHLNLHKTFCIPHGGGGPGVGPVGVAEHLVPFLPTHPLHPDVDRRAETGAISAAPYGSAGILPIPYAYIAMMGAQGLTDATSVAVLAANYVAARLSDAFPVLYTGENGLVAHECILDVKSVAGPAGVTIDDVAKRLIDYGFHAPTMSFPVAGTLMVEPTESEDLAELDRFCEAMLAIRAEIDRVAAGEYADGDTPLAGAPHAARELLDWSHGYPVAEGLFPTGVTQDKYWPPVGRIDQAYGDRNLMCSCPPPEAFAPIG
ncbi:glycine dehydrogenase (aminomethyl-transferring) [Aeromicrobium sp. PE09-221]|uniref:aminomethyl-transferring glycine dehydrogenase n=1 Tax=Aeromicrobium sp. PE09-221 TaxID=1898043 RepID=UPI000B3E6D76|nr:aminomethyl-transferring glycine dehydrogenase [Aeromicrobium sp. PE09-221]OUZ11028.1 glycine dehydrogenase (aminomethyl-transferring) [Aeromicrobium sp. PE09-221]